MDFGNALKHTHALINTLDLKGTNVVDATMGNGHDTEFLCDLVGEEGMVIAFDIQKEALINTEKRLAEKGLLSRARLILDSHENINKYVEGARVIMFNLGWLPGHDHSVTTDISSTLSAIQKSLCLIEKGGLITICVYPGHERGAKELVEIDRLLSDIDDSVFDCVRFGYVNIKRKPPVLYAITKRN